ncbi:hypothetical protein [Cognatishimia sp. F0-27]|uniref:hypothetical protein n=1 Tax=Cognatishimia sp. F0-27 TaxID=2816855 RepID=UPI001D0C3FFD|nr:hypothetical protein [Cognatishimia sp. F0-27]MCC1494541.1 hypothetical protein [Cognatishimia sp. F0-27]
MNALTIAMGKSPIARAFLDGHAQGLGLAPVDVSPIHRAFRPMVEDCAFDIAELAIVTAIQAVEAGRAIIPLPLTIAARFQHKCTVQNARFSQLSPKDLEGKRVAVRAYSQTTGAWARTILDTEYGVDTRKITWVTHEGPHVRGAPEPDNVLRDPDATPTYELLRDGLVDAAIFGNDMPGEDWVCPVIPDPDAAAQQSLRRTGVVQINHVLAVTAKCAATAPDRVRTVAEGLMSAKAELDIDGPDLLPMGADALRGSVDVLLGSIHRQGLTRRAMRFDDVFGAGSELLS